MKGGRSKPETKTTDNRLKRKGAATERAGKKTTTKKEKAVKDPNKPKRPPSAFFVFMEDFRQTYKEKHPNNKSVAAVGKAGGDKWKSLTDALKAPYQAKAEKRKEEYNKKMIAYNKKEEEATKSAEEDESDKSKSEVNDDEDNEDESDEDDEDDD